MADRNASPPSTSSSGAVGRCHRQHSTEEDGAAECTGKSCQSCTASVIADCVAVCCCPCALVNLLTLAFVKLPWAMARKWVGRRKMKRLEEERRRGGGRDRDGISENGRAGEGTSEIVVNIGEELNDHFSAGFKGEDVWLELYQLGHLGFGRVSFTGIPFQHKSD